MEGNENYLWIFETAPCWSYCGGAVVIAARTFERAVELAHGFVDKDGDKVLVEHGFYEKLRDIPGLKATYYDQNIAWADGGPFVHCSVDDPRATQWKTDEGWDKWLLVRSYAIFSLLEEVVLAAWNYA